MIKAILFDFDGVIVESVDIKTKAFARLFKNEGRSVSRQIVDYHLHNLGVSRYKKFRNIYKAILKRSLSNIKFKMLCAKFSRLVMENVIDAPYVKGAKEFLRRYSGSYKCFLLSATPKQELFRIIKRRKIRHFFKAIYGAPAEKSAIIKNILTKENIKAKYAVYLGDSLSDYTAAKENSVRFIARVKGNRDVFKSINCIKIKDLRGLQNKIKILARRAKNN